MNIDLSFNQLTKIVVSMYEGLANSIICINLQNNCLQVV
jgi:hypothetical protein